MAIELSDQFKLELFYLSNVALQRYKQVCPALIAAAVRADTNLCVYDQGDESLNEIAADEIEKAGALVYFLDIKFSQNLSRLMKMAKGVSLKVPTTPDANENLFNVIQTHTEFPNLKVLHCQRCEIAVAILARSQVEEFSVSLIYNVPALLQQVSTQTQLKQIQVEEDILDVEAFINYLPQSVQKLSFSWAKSDKKQLLVLILNCTLESVTVFGTTIKNLEEILDKYLDVNQESEGNRIRQFYGWKFRVSASNRILNLQRPDDI